MNRIGMNEYTYVKQVLDGEFRSSHGSTMMQRLEREFSRKFHANYSIAHNNGTATLHAAIMAAGVGLGDEVIVPPLTMSATSFAVLHNNAIPVFADVDMETFNISPAAIRKAITARTKAIMPVSLYGLPCDSREIRKIADEYNLVVIEDNAQCFLGKIHGKIAGSYSDMASYSFQSSKHMTCGEGGMITTNSESLANSVRQFSSLGYAGVGSKQGKITKREIQEPDYCRHVTLGWNYRLSEICSAVALGQLESLDLLVEQRKRSAELFLEAIKGCSWLRAQKVPVDFESAYWTVAVVLENEYISWRKFRDCFVANGGDGIYSAWKVTYLEPMYINMNMAGREKFLKVSGEMPQQYVKGLCKNSEYLQERMLQFKTNYWNRSDAEAQAGILKKTINQLDSI